MEKACNQFYWHILYEGKEGGPWKENKLQGRGKDKRFKWQGDIGMEIS